MLLRDCLKNNEWNLVKEIMRFISSIDPADFENEVFDLDNDNNNTTTSANGSRLENQISFRLNKSTSSNKTTSSTSSLIVSPTKKLTTNDSFTESNKSKPTPATPSGRTSLGQGGKRLSINDLELSKKSIESTIYEYANELIKNYEIKKLFEMFSNLAFLNINKWLEQYQ
jgi:hypothetical protein